MKKYYHNGKFCHIVKREGDMVMLCYKEPLGGVSYSLGDVHINQVFEC